MPPRIVGAGVGRTGTLSLKLALERLLGEPCYHMMEVFSHPAHASRWLAAARGEPVDWSDLLRAYGAAVDWPAAAFWPELAEAFPDALVLFSVRAADRWWESASETIFRALRASPEGEWRSMIEAVLGSRFTLALDDREAVVAAYENHNERVRAAVPRERLIEWHPGDGWEPLCRALDVAVPEEPFPHVNTRADFLGRHAPAPARAGVPPRQRR